jgi:two-component sensor histidine kinase
MIDLLRAETATHHHGLESGLRIADRLSGRTSARQGFGTRMMTAPVSQLSGHLDFEDNTPGVRAVLSAPIVHQ